MAILETEVDVALNSQSTIHYEALGYKIPRRKDTRGTLRVRRGTTLRVKVSDLQVGCTVKLTKVCDTCRKKVYDQPYRVIIHHRDNGVDRCSTCGRVASVLQKALSGHNIATKSPSALKLFHPSLNNKLTPTEITPGSNSYVWWLCDEEGCGHEWKAMVASVVIQGNRCPNCNMSKGECRIREYLRFLGYLFTRGKKYDKLTGVNGGQLSYDFVVTRPNGECALLIEFDGIQHDKPRDMDGKGEAHALEAFHIQREHDRRKDAYALAHNIPLLRIKHTEFDDIERKINEALAQIIRGDRIAC